MNAFPVFTESERGLRVVPSPTCHGAVYPSRMHHKNIAIVAHDHRKRDLIEWAEWNYRTLLDHHLVCTGTPDV